MERKKLLQKRADFAAAFSYFGGGALTDAGAAAIAFAIFQ